jgi:hypothetical protein
MLEGANGQGCDEANGGPFSTLQQGRRGPGRGRWTSLLGTTRVAILGSAAIDNRQSSAANLTMSPRGGQPVSRAATDACL